MNLSGIAITENLATRRAYDAQQDYAIRQQMAEGALADEFIRAARGPLHLPVQFARRHDGRAMSAYEVLHDAIDYDDFMERAMAILCDVAFSKGDRRADARELMEQMAAKYAGQNAEVDE